MKSCTKCSQSKNPTEFFKDKGCRDGLSTRCKVCANKHIKEWKKKNPELVKLSRQRYERKNKWVVNAKTARRYATKLNATPKWLTQDQLEHIKKYYECAQFLNSIFTGQTMDVDHIIPLRGKDVCGLHVPWNLQIFEHKENIAKGNRVE